MAETWQRKTPAREAVEGAQKRPRVLVVDADPGTRRALARLLAAEGLAVIGAASAGEALAACADCPPELVILDFDLGPPGGADACERLRARTGADTPILARSARNDEHTIAAAFEAGASDFASKSEPLAALVQRARRQLRAGSQLAALRASETRLRESQRLAQLASFRYELATRTLGGDDELWRVLGSERGTLPQLAPAQREAFAERVRECLRTGRPVSGDLTASGADGVERHLRYRMQLALGAEGEALALEGVVQDVTAWRRSQARAELLAERDSVTGLPNRAGLLRAADERIAERRRMVLAPEAAVPGAGVAAMRAAEAPPALIAIGLEGIGRVAETLGREAADELLCEASRRLAADNPDALLARTGESQLALLVPHARDADVLALRAERALAALDVPIRVAAHELFVPASAGTALLPADGEDAASLLRSAERALAQARSGGPRVQAHSSATSAAALRRFTLASRLRGAAARGELTLHYQPKVALGSGELVGFEGLVRWLEPEFGLLAPGEFIPLAEEAGLVGEIGDWVLREACRQIAAWREAGLGDIPVAVNVSAHQLRRSGLAARVAEILREAGVRPALLGIEITESVLLDDAERAIRELRALRELGVELALDDFGTGFSSLSYLRRLPVQVVKIDREFIAEISAREDSAALTAQVVALAKALWLRVIAEGVEREEQRELVAIWGCEEAQGFLFSRPVIAQEAAELWRDRGPRSQAERAAG